MMAAFGSALDGLEFVIRDLQESERGPEGPDEKRTMCVFRYAA
jgi:hypothetical protein